MRPTGIVLGIAMCVGGMALQGCGDNHYYCGEGTQASDGQCIDIGTECGPGTHDEDGECVLDEEVIICGEGTEEVDGECVVILETGLPPVLDAVTSPTPYPSGGLMILEGDNFALSDSGPMTVTVDGVAATNVMVLSNNIAIADLPVAPAVVVPVAISNDLGNDAMDFQYTGLYAALGGQGESLSDPAELHLLDPRDGTTLVVGPITSDAGTVNRPVTGMAFAPDGTLYAIEASYSGATADLLTIDPLTGDATFVVAVSVPRPVLTLGVPLTSASFPDIEFVGATLYAFSKVDSDLVTIDTTTGTVTFVDVSPDGWYGLGLAAADDGTLLLASFGDGLQQLQADGTSLGLASFDSDIAGMSALAWANGRLYATHGGGGIAVFDFEADTIRSFGPSDFFYDALATPPALDDAPGAPPALDPPPSLLPAHRHDLMPDVHQAALPTFAPFEAKAALDARGRRSVALADVVTGDRVTLRSSTMDMTLARGELAGYRLVENRRGKLKLVDIATGRPVLRAITQIEEN